MVPEHLQGWNSGWSGSAGALQMRQVSGGTKVSISSRLRRGAACLAPLLLAWAIKSSSVKNYQSCRPLRSGNVRAVDASGRCWCDGHKSSLGHTYAGNRVRTQAKRRVQYLRCGQTCDLCYSGEARSVPSLNVKRRRPTFSPRRTKAISILSSPHKRSSNSTPNTAFSPPYLDTAKE